MEPMVGVQPGTESRYYTRLGRATDFILRCKDCRTIATVDVIAKLGGCPGDGVTGCGNKRFSEITQLTPHEHARLEVMDFPHKAEFLAEFAARG